MKLPRITNLRQDDTHRLIRAKYADGGESVLRRLTDQNRELDDLFELEGATNERALGEAGLLPGISVHELVFGVSYAHIVNAAFTYAHPSGSRFNPSDRGAWYAAFARETAIAQVVFHTRQEFQEIDWRDEERISFADYLADFRSEFHDIRGDKKHAGCLAPDSYQSSQSLARQLLRQGSAGIIYPSVRDRGGTCLACFRPALVSNVRKGATVNLVFRNGDTVGDVEIISET